MSHTNFLHLAALESALGHSISVAQYDQVEAQGPLLLMALTSLLSATSDQEVQQARQAARAQVSSLFSSAETKLPPGPRLESEVEAILKEFASTVEASKGEAAQDRLLAEATRKLSNVFAAQLFDLSTQLSATAADRDDADRRAGTATRRMERAREDVERFERVRAQMKREWGVSDNISFDVVWAQALELHAAAHNQRSVALDSDSKLNPQEAAFVLRVLQAPGAKLANVPLGIWTRPEDRGLVNAVGSWKWEPTPALFAYLQAAITTATE